MDHRSGCGFEENTGDGAGILMALPDSFFQEESKKLKYLYQIQGNMQSEIFFFRKRLMKEKNVKKLLKK